MPTFPTWPGELPRCLDPLNWRHYFLLLYWLFFRPTALKCYLYWADPSLYHFNFNVHRLDGLGFWNLIKSQTEATHRLIARIYAIPAYRQLVILVTRLIVAISALSLVLRMTRPVIGFAESLITYSGSNNLTSSHSSEFLQSMVIQAAIELLTAALLTGFALGISLFVLLLEISGGAAVPLGGGVVNGLRLGVVYMIFYGFLTSAAIIGIAPHSIIVLALFLISTVISSTHLGEPNARISVFGYYAIVFLYFVLGGKIIGGGGFLAVLAGILRAPIYFIQCVGLLGLPWRFSHPIWWDECARLPFFKTDEEISRTWNQGEEYSLLKLVRLAANPFQCWVLQRSLVLHLDKTHDPIGFIYRLLRLRELDVYAYAPCLDPDWKEFPSARQVFIAEMAGRGNELSRGIGKFVHDITKPLRLPSSTPLSSLAGLLHTISRLSETPGRPPEAKELPLVFSPSLFQQLLDYPGGSELQSSFTCLAHSLQATSLSDLTQIPALLLDLPPARDAIRPEVIEALRRLEPISQNIAVAQTASSRLNQLAAFARATEALEELGPFIEQTVVVPEKVMLLRIRNHWRTLVAEAGGRLGHQVERQRVVNPYVAGNPVKGGLFVGRDELLGQLEELWLKTGQVDSLVLYGHRRMGKSSILQNLPHRLDPATNWVVDFNLQTVNRSHTGSLLFDLAGKMHDHLQSYPEGSQPAALSDALTLPKEEAFRANYQRAFNQWLDRLAPRMAGRRFIIAIDEYELLEEAMADGRLDQELTRYLRGVIQSRDWFVLALAGLHTLREQCHDYWHPLFASIKPRKVSFLSPAASRRLLTQPSDDFPLDYSAAALDAIHSLTNGQPYLVQLIGQNLVAQYNRQVLAGEREPDQPLDLADLEAVIGSPDFFADGSAYFNGVWAQAADAPPGQQAILLALAQGSLNLDDLVDRAGLANAASLAALDTLEAHDVVCSASTGGYGFTVELMRRWVEHQKVQGGQRPTGSST